MAAVVAGGEGEAGENEDDSGRPGPGAGGANETNQGEAEQGGDDQPQRRGNPQSVEDAPVALHQPDGRAEADEAEDGGAEEEAEGFEDHLGGSRWLK